MITVSDAAKAYIDKLQGEQPDNKGKFIRVGVRGGGCSGLEYQLEFDSDKRPDDQVFEDKGITVLVDRPNQCHQIGNEMTFGHRRQRLQIHE